MSEQQRDFKGVWIPKIVWLDERLNALDKVILTEIDSLDQGERGCWASNKHIAAFCQCSESKVSKAISKLMKLGYLRMQSFDGRQREIRSCLSSFEKLPSKKCEADYQKMIESNTSNNTATNTDISKKESKKASGSFDKLIADYAKGNAVLIDLLGEWLKVRKAKRAAMTDRAISMNLDKLDDMAKQSRMSAEDYLKEVICRGWAAFYVIKQWSGSAATQKHDNRFYAPNRDEEIGETFNFDFD